MLKGICAHDLFCMEVSVKDSTTVNSRQKYLDKKIFLRNIFIYAIYSGATASEKPLKSLAGSKANFGLCPLPGNFHGPFHTERLISGRWK